MGTLPGSGGVRSTLVLDTCFLSVLDQELSL